MPAWDIQPSQVIVHPGVAGSGKVVSKTSTKEGVVREWLINNTIRLDNLKGAHHAVTAAHLCNHSSKDSI